MGPGKGGKNRESFILAEHSDEGGVLPQLDGLARWRREHLEDSLRSCVEDASPLVEPDARPGLNLPESLDVPASAVDCAQRITHDLAGDGAMQPQRAQLLAAETTVWHERLDVHPPYTPVDTDPRAEQLPGVAQVDNVLA